jgi:hypothetical protein
MSPLALPIHAASETAKSHGITPDRCDILQNGNTLVLRLTENLVARIVTDIDGPRQGMAWFSRENAVAQHLASLGAPVIPMHPQIPPGPHLHSGYTLNFWQYVHASKAEPPPHLIGSTLHQCHATLRTFPQNLPEMAILNEALKLTDSPDKNIFLTHQDTALLRERILSSLNILADFPRQALHGDAHPGNLLLTTQGLLWTDWEDTFSGPVEWDLASILWNARILDEDHAHADAILDGYRSAGGTFDPVALHHAFIARAAVMCIWYPILYPDATPERLMKLHRRLDWLRDSTSS